MNSGCEMAHPYSEHAGASRTFCQGNEADGAQDDPRTRCDTCPQVCPAQAIEIVDRGQISACDADADIAVRRRAGEHMPQADAPFHNRRQLRIGHMAVSNL